MRIVSLLITIVGCAKSAPPPEPPSNAASSTASVESSEPARESPHAFIPSGNGLPLGPAGTCTVGGETLDKQTREVLAGVTLIVTVGDASEPMITDENGRFLLHRTTVPEKIHAYYLDIATESPFRPSWCGQALRIEIDQRAAGSSPIPL